MWYAYDLWYSCFVDSHTDFDFCECWNILVWDNTCLCKERNCEVLSKEDFYKLPDKQNPFSNDWELRVKRYREEIKLNSDLLEKFINKEKCTHNFELVTTNVEMWINRKHSICNMCWLWEK